MLNGKGSVYTLSIVKMSATKNVYVDAVFLFITQAGAVVDGTKYAYNDKKVVNKNEVTIDYSSQKIWTTGDALLKRSDISTFIFMRRTMRDTFKYAGKVTRREVIQERTEDAPLRMLFTIAEPRNSHREFPALPEPISGRFKMGVYNALGVTPATGKGIQTGIVPVRWNFARA